jgi:bacteriorhodopsin
MIFYGILDIFAGPVFLFFFLALLRQYDYERFGFQSGKASDYVGGGGGGGGPCREKEQEALPA